MDDLAGLTRAILTRFHDPEAEFQLQAVVGGAEESVWLRRRGARVTLQVIGPGGGETDWKSSGFRDIDPQKAFHTLRSRIDLVTLYAGGPFPDELMRLFVPDETQPVASYKAEWPSWDAFEGWLSAPQSPPEDTL
jgi:hypothetical protein